VIDSEVESSQSSGLEKPVGVDAWKEVPESQQPTDQQEGVTIWALFHYIDLPAFRALTLLLQPRGSEPTFCRACSVLTLYVRSHWTYESEYARHLQTIITGNTERLTSDQFERV
jgi:hypothetical protein